MKSGFASYHPAVNFLYFVFILGFSMVFTHPLCRLFSLLGACFLAVRLMGKRALRFQMKIVLPMMLLAALVNPAFSHEGVSVLFYLPSGNPLTFESIFYGLSMSVMLASVVIWFSSYHEIMTSDKFIYLFGRVIPSLSLLFSMALRFVPRFKEQLRAVSNAQRCIGRDIALGSLSGRIRNGARILSVMITWSLENAIETADSMKSRGYGEKRRTAFSLYRFDERDRSAVSVILGLGVYVLFMSLHGDFYWRYYPSLRGVSLSLWSVSSFTAYAFFCFVPLMIENREEKRWNSIASKI